MDIYNFIHHSQDIEETKCLSANESINKLWYIQTLGYYLALKINKLSSYEKV